MNIVYPGDPCDSPNYNFRTSNENEIKIYDFYGTLVYTKKYKEEKIKLKGIDLKKGNYIINVLTAKGILKKKSFL